MLTPSRSAPPASVPRYSQGSNRSDSVLTPNACQWRSDQLGRFSLIRANILSTPSAPFHRTVWQYSKADWCGFRSYIRDIADKILSESVHKSAHELSESKWLLTGIETYIPHRTYQVKPHSLPWFTPECAAAIC